MNQYFLYCRKSSEEEDRQALSIESQIGELERFAKKEQLRIVARFQESRSAKSPGRPIFTDVLRRIEKGEADGILAWHPDRLARNALDGGHVIHLLDCGQLQNLRFPTYTFENTSQGKFMLAIMFGQSKYYVDSLSENVRRGNRTKREKGWLPGRAPIGYVNITAETGEKIIVTDKERFPLLKQVWEMLLSGGYSVPQLLEIATDQMGLRTPKKKRVGGKPLSVSGIYRVLSNPFYAGQILFHGQWYPGRQKAMITVAQFQQTQALLGRTGAARPKKHVFPYTGLIRCGTCGGGVTAEEKINPYGSLYVYYHCGHKKRDVVCREKCLEVHDLEKQIVAFLRGIHLDQHEVDQLLGAIEEERAKERQAGGSVKQAIEKALGGCSRNLDALTKMRFRELIGDDEFVRQRTDLTLEQSKLQDRLQKLETDHWVELSQKLFLFSNRAIFWLTHGTATEKRLVLAASGSNFVLKAKILSIDAKKPFHMVRQNKPISNWSPQRDIHRDGFIFKRAVDKDHIHARVREASRCLGARHCASARCSETDPGCCVAIPGRDSNRA